MDGKYVPSEKVKEYFRILSPRFPSWLNDYINTEPLLKQHYISTSCGTIYSDLFNTPFFYSNLDHSVGVALVIWHFTKDKKQTLSGLFHDIATPVFKHCVDYMNGDYSKQESTEDLTTDIIKNSPEIMKLLKRDKIKLSEVENYHLYPIADNDTPKLSADRLEYSLADALFKYGIIEIGEVKELYKDIVIQKNQDEVELGFTTATTAAKFVKITSTMSIFYREDKTRYSMQFIADILKRLNADGKITKSDLYNLKESDVIDLIKNSKYCSIFDIWRTAKEVKTSKTKPENTYSVYCGSKVRYIDPLVNGIRISEIDEASASEIQNNLSYDMNNYVYLDLNFPE